MATISAVINVVSEELAVLPRLLASIRSLASEIVIVDMTEGGKISDLAKKFEAKVYPHERVSYVEAARNFGISKAKGEWIFILDPDEEIPSTLAARLVKLANNTDMDYFRIPRKNIIFGKWIKHARWWPDYNIRFFKKGSVSWNEIVHAVPMTQGKGIEINEKEEFAIIHHHYDSLEQYLERMNRYTSAHAKVLVKEGSKFSWKALLGKPANEFLSRYFFGEGYKDGIHGLALSLLQAFSEVVVQLKIWQSEKFAESTPNVKDVIEAMRNSEKEFHFWQADAMLRETRNIGYRIRRKLKI